MTVTQARFDKATAEQIHLRDVTVVIQEAKVQLGGRSSKVKEQPEVRKIKEVTVIIDRICIGAEAVKLKAIDCCIFAEGLEVKVKIIRIVAASLVIKPC